MVRGLYQEQSSCIASKSLGGMNSSNTFHIHDAVSQVLIYPLVRSVRFFVYHSEKSGIWIWFSYVIMEYVVSQMIMVIDN